MTKVTLDSETVEALIHGASCIHLDSYNNEKRREIGIAVSKAVEAMEIQQ